MYTTYCEMTETKRVELKFVTLETTFAISVNNVANSFLYNYWIINQKGNKIINRKDLNLFSNSSKKSRMIILYQNL